MNKTIHGLGILIITNLVHARIIQSLVKSALKTVSGNRILKIHYESFKTIVFPWGKNVNMLLLIIDYFK